MPGCLKLSPGASLAALAMTAGLIAEPALAQGRCFVPNPAGRVFYAPFDTVIGPDVISQTPNTGTQPGPNRYLVTSSIPNHSGQVLRLNPVAQADTTDLSGRIRFLRDGMTGPSPFAFDQGDFSISFWMRTQNPSAVFLTTRQRTDDNGFLGRGVMVRLGQGRLSLRLDLGSANRASPSIGLLDVQAAPMLADDRWHVITITVDRDNPQGSAIHIDGVRVAQFDPRSVSGSLGERNFLGLGFESVSQRNDSGFEIDEIEIYHRVLSPNEIAERHMRLPICR